MSRSNSLIAAVILAAVAALLLASLGDPEIPPASTLLFWIALLLIANLLPVALGFGTEITMSFPIHIAVAILFNPFIAMVVTGLGSFDMREIRRQISVFRALFNRAQLMLAVGTTSSIIMLNQSGTFSFPNGLLAITVGAGAMLLINLGLVAAAISTHHGIPIREAFRNLVPNPAGGFWLAQFVLAGFGVATAAAYQRVGAFVAAFLIPLLFARLSIIGARTQQELSERVQKQQQSLLQATERVFQEREDERHKIAEEIHDSSLQMLAAATYGLENATELIGAGHQTDAAEAVESVRGAVDGAIRALRESLVDLRRSVVVQGGLMETIRRFSEQTSVLWGRDISIEGDIQHEPPIPVALAAFQILQEGLTNALKHTQESAITVRIDEVDAMVHIIVEDEGPGFDPEIRIGEDHVGMRLMKERAARVGGRIELASQPGTGTKLEAILPAGVTH
jgi:signal transduction histidine kinase